MRVDDNKGRDFSINYRSPQQIQQTRKPNIENQVPPQRNTLDYIKHMKKRQCDDRPLSVISQNLEVFSDAKSIAVDFSKIDMKSNCDQSTSLYDGYLQKQQVDKNSSRCTSYRSFNQEAHRQSRPYIDQNVSLMCLQQQMGQLQTENMYLKQRIEQQDQLKFQQMQQQLIQLQGQQPLQYPQQQSAPIVINNHIVQPELKSVPTYQSMQYLSPDNLGSVQSQQAQYISNQPYYSLQQQQQYQQQYQPQLQQPQLQPQQQPQTMQSIQNLLPQQSSINHSEQSIQLITTSTQPSQIVQPTERMTMREGNETDRSFQYQSSQIRQPQRQTARQSEATPSVDTALKPSVRMEFNFGSPDPKTLADCFQNRKPKQQDRKVSAPEMADEKAWIVNVNRRSKEEQMKLRKEMMEYGRKRRPVEAPDIRSRAVSPVMERLISGQKAKVDAKEMYELTRKHYENLPEIKEKKNEEATKVQKQNFIKERQNKVKELDEKIKQKLTKAKK